MNEELALTPYNASAELAIAKPAGQNYNITVAGLTTKIKRDVDFGVIPKTKKPSLYKSGAEKICMAYGLLQQYQIESKIEQGGKEPFFFYNVKCNLVKVVNGTEYVLTSAYGSANTGEKRNGFNSAFDSANSTLKMAQKRALVAAALSISGLSDAFTQDMENEEFMTNAKVLVDTDTPDSPVTSAQIKRLYAIGGQSGLNAAQVKQLLAANGYTSSKQILQKDYEAVCDLLRKAGEENVSND
jgi:hypothetical protein